jgi:hypothetical protein
MRKMSRQIAYKDQVIRKLRDKKAVEADMGEDSN